MFTVNGFSFSGQGQKLRDGICHLKPSEERNGEENSVEAVNAVKATRAFSQIRDGLVFPQHAGKAIVEQVPHCL